MGEIRTYFFAAITIPIKEKTEDPKKGMEDRGKEVPEQ